MIGKDAEFVRELAQTFTHRERQVLTLHYCEELTPIEIGLVLDMSTLEVDEALVTLRERTRNALEAREKVGGVV